MRPFKPKENRGEEDRIQTALIAYLEARQWYVKIMVGNAYQSGVPDLYCHHAKYGKRWIEVKVPVGYSFTAAQRTEFPKMVIHGDKIWVLTAATDDEYKKLFGPHNILQYLFG